MSNSDIRHAIRKLEFPACAKETLLRIEPIINNRNKQNFVMHLINEFVFLERSIREPDVRRMPDDLYMTLLQEFQLIHIFVQHFSKPGPEETRNAIFLSLFASNPTPQRTRILSRLVSTAVSGYVASLLSAAGCFLQQAGCGSPAAFEISRTIISDFLVYCRSTSERLKSLPLVAPHFAANLITAITEHYMNEQKSSCSRAIPSDALLEILAEWLDEHPTLCLASQQPLALPSGAIAMPVATPLIGLTRWSVILPLLVERVCMSSIHMALLRNIAELKDANKDKIEVLNAQHLTVVANFLQSQTYKYEPIDEECLLYKCLDRYAQIVHLALVHDCVTGNIPQLLAILELLPTHFLIQHIITSNKQKELKT